MDISLNNMSLESNSIISPLFEEPFIGQEMRCETTDDEFDGILQQIGCNNIFDTLDNLNTNPMNISSNDIVLNNANSTQLTNDNILFDSSFGILNDVSFNEMSSTPSSLVAINPMTVCSTNSRPLSEPMIVDSITTNISIPSVKQTVVNGSSVYNQEVQLVRPTIVQQSQQQQQSQQIDLIQSQTANLVNLTDLLSIIKEQKQQNDLLIQQILTEQLNSNTQQWQRPLIPVLTTNANLNHIQPVVPPLIVAMNPTTTLLTNEPLILQQQQQVTGKIGIERLSTNCSTAISTIKRRKSNTNRSISATSNDVTVVALPSTHSDSKRRYRSSINDPIIEIEEIIFGSQKRLSKPKVLREAIKYINNLKDTNAKLKQEINRLNSFSLTNNLLPSNKSNVFIASNASTLSQNGSNQSLISNNNKGYCYLLNNCFSDATKQVMQHFLNQFYSLDFDIIARTSISAEEIYSDLVNISTNESLSNLNAFAFIAISHGNDMGEIYGSDEKTLKIDSLVNLFNENNCPRMIGKPQIFFINYIATNSSVNMSESFDKTFINICPSIPRKEKESLLTTSYSSLEGGYLAQDYLTNLTKLGEATADGFVRNVKYKDLIEIIAGIFSNTNTQYRIPIAEFYKKEFKEIKNIGIGRFADVFEVEKLNDSNKLRFAVKRIKMKKYKQINDAITEFEPGEFLNFSVLKELKNKNIIQYYDLWLENENQNQLSFAFIQMELCDKSLYELLQEFKRNHNIYEDATLTSLGYYIESEIFCQILEGVNYLHERTPQIIHRNLNPNDILILMNYPNKNVVKIADFGLSCLHSLNGQMHTQDRGPIGYIAPEVEISTRYDTRADIYSLGKILGDLFSIDANRDYILNNESSLLMNKYKNIQTLFIEMTEHLVRRRPQTCRHILDEKHLWTLNQNDFNLRQEFNEYCYNCDQLQKDGYVFNLIKLLME